MEVSITGPTKNFILSRVDLYHSFVNVREDIYTSMEKGVYSCVKDKVV